MKNLTSIQRSIYNPRTILAYVVTSAVLLGLIISMSSRAYAYVPLTAQLDFGARNANVTSLQQFFATMPSIYPEGLVTGYFGALTRAAVMRFQVQQGIVSSGTAATTGYGRVGPTTLARINSLMAGGVPIPSPTGDVSGPSMFMQFNPTLTSTTAVFNWTTNESATGRVYYSTSPLQMNEGDINGNGFAVTSGQLGSYDGIARTSHTSTLSGLQPNTLYYYTIVGTDLNGNVSIIGPNSTFRTTQ
jgi:hypothetical protein